MAVFVDEIKEYDPVVIKGRAARYGGRWCHMTATTEAELHEFAFAIGLKREWAQRPGTPRAHYDLVPAKRAAAVAAGALEVRSAARLYYECRHKGCERPVYPGEQHCPEHRGER